MVIIIFKYNAVVEKMERKTIKIETKVNTRKDKMKFLIFYTCYYLDWVFGLGLDE